MDIIGVIVGGALGAVIGVVLGWLICDRKGRGAVAEAATAKAVIEQQLTALDAERSRLVAERTKEAEQNAIAINQREAALEEVRRRLGEAEKRSAAAEAGVGEIQKSYLEKQRALSALEAETDRLRKESTDLRSLLTGATEALKASNERVEEQRQMIEAANKKLSDCENVRSLQATAEEKVAGLSAELKRRDADHTAETEGLREKLKLLEAETERLRNELGEMRDQCTSAKEGLKASQDNIAEQRKLIDDANQRLSAAFAEVSNAALDRANLAFLQMAKAKFETLSAEAGGALDQRKEQIATLLTPLQEVLAAYQKRLGEIEATRASAYGDLLKQIGGMSATQQALAQQTTQLATALKKSNVRGRWGEIALQRLVEMSGMTEHVDYALQESVRSDEGLLRPDMIVKFSGNRNVVVDSKAVMAAFLEAAAAVDEAGRTAHLQAHARNVRARVDDLSSKAYWNQFAVAPEFTILFLPGESFLYAACDHDSDLIQYAISKKVLLATPTTLIGLLRTVELGWRQEGISQNAEAIRTLGVEIYDRLATLADHLTKLGSSLNGAVDNFNKVVGTVEGRVLVSARKMGELGARSEKTIANVDTLEKRPREFSEALHPEKSPLLPE